MVKEFNQFLLDRVRDKMPPTEDELWRLKLIAFRLANYLGKVVLPPNAEFTSLIQNATSYPERNSVIIDGFLRARETMNVIAAPKTGKTWLMMQLAVSVALGKPWLGRPVAQKRILVVDNELHPGELTWRFRKVCDAMNVRFSDLEGRLFLWSQRGDLKGILALGERLTEIRALGVEVILVDAFYRAVLAGVDENSNSAMMHLYNTIDRYAKELNSAFILVHHTTKGTQKEKSVTDIGAGAGSMARAADTHLVLLRNEKDGSVSLKAVCRSFASVTETTLVQKFPLWQVLSF